MNRKIKFRVWDNDENRWLSCCSIGEDGEVSADMIRQKSRDWIVQQATGLKDKNDMEIYEGDLVRHVWGDGTISKDVQLVDFNNDNYGGVMGWNLLDYGTLKKSGIISIADGELEASTHYYGESPSESHMVIGNIFEGVINA